MSRPSGIFDVRYEQDMQLIRTPLQKITLVLGLSLIISLPFFAGNYWVTTLIFVYIAIIGALGLNILIGYSGLISLGQAAFMAVGAYSALVYDKFLGLQFIPSLLLAGLTSAGAGVVFGLPSARLRGFYLALTTLVGHFIVLFIIYTPWVAQYIGVPHGILMPNVRLGPLELPSEYRLLSFYYITLAAASLFALATANLFRTRTGRALVAIRDNDVVAELVGINTYRYKLMAFAISSFYVGIAGALYAYYLRVLVPGYFDFRVTIEYIAMILLGGLGRVWGSILGATFIVLLSEGLKLIVSNIIVPIVGVGAASLLEPLRLSIFGAIIIIMILLEPYGIVNLLRRIKEYFRLWPFRY